jgi:hypothetical protein
MPAEDNYLLLCCMLWARDGEAVGLREYEDRVLALIPVHGGQVVQRALSDGRDGNPHEVQLIGFATEDGIDAYLADPRRTALTAERERAVQRTVVFRVRLR